MERMRGADKAVFGGAISSADSNRFYSILLDARASAVSENMFDVAEKLLLNEKDNAKVSLEKLWSLKKSLQGDVGVATIEMLIQHYQDKLDVLRSREERIRGISKDSRKLLEDKRARDAEIATVKQNLAECTKQFTELKDKMHKLAVREQELTLIDTQLSKELKVNENEVVNGLYEIILANHQETLQAEEATQQMPLEPLEPLSAPSLQVQEALTEAIELPELPELSEPFEIHAPLPPSPEYDSARVIAAVQQLPPAPFPKSVVKTTRGRIIGEYFYDSRAYKDKRHYVFNSRFFFENAMASVKSLRAHFDQERYNDLIQMTQDAVKRVTQNQNIHFEVSTNEILNHKSLKELLGLIKVRSWDELERFASRLGAKIGALNGNYQIVLREQMERLNSGQ
jgi:hypothetical protein